MFILDAHLDLAMNAMEWNRDLRCSVFDIRNRESGMQDKPGRALGTVAFPELKQGNIGIVVATLISRYVKQDNPLPGWNSQEQAWAHSQGQWAWYLEMERQGWLKMIRTAEDLMEHLTSWTRDRESSPIGFVLSLEGADSILSPEDLHRSYQQGLRILGPAHYGPGIYAHGTHSIGGIGDLGRQLLKTMDQLGMILDLTHLSDMSFYEALEVFQGPVWASHSNCRSLVPDQRQFADEHLKLIIERGGVIGMPLDAWMMVPNWIKGQSNPENTDVRLEHMIQHIDHICQLSGNDQHVGIGTDLDGGFGKEQSPSDLDTIADLQKLPDLLKSKGYTQESIERILHRNFLDFLSEHLP